MRNIAVYYRITSVFAESFLLLDFSTGLIFDKKEFKISF